jgi:two-component system phosphate regulon sensor histidine kinase PhoR
MLTASASRLRDWALFAAAALVPAIAVAVLGLRAVANEEAGARRELASSLDAAAEREGARLDRDLAAAAADLGRARLAGTAADLGKVATEIAPPFADAVVLDATRALLFPVGPLAPAKVPASCTPAARNLAVSRDAAARERARATLIADCADAVDDAGRWLWPIVALDSLSRGARADDVAVWLEAHRGRLAPLERDVTRTEIEHLAFPEPARGRSLAALDAAGSPRDELASVLRADEISAALRGRRDPNGVVTFRAGRAAGALRVLDDGRMAGFVVTARSLSSALAPTRSAAPPGIAVDVVSVASIPDHDGLAARADLTPTLGLRFTPADRHAVARHAARSRLLLVGLAAVTTVFAFAFAAVLFARMRAARRSSALRTDFVSTVSHELRTPIASVRMLAELLEQDRVEPEERAEVHEALAKEARRLGETVDRLLGFSRMEAGRVALAKQTMPLVDAVEPSILTFEERHPSLAVERELDTSVEASVDPDQVRLAVDNLLANAAKYAPGGAPYRVRVAAREGGAVVSVTDRGAGIARRDQARIFRPFERADDRLSRATEGSGIGLSLVAHVARAHGGEVSLESAPGQGATFTLFFPRNHG